MTTQTVLFLCTGNSCRSQMAEGLLRHLGQGRFDVYSAGTKPSRVNPKAIQVMQEIGIDITQQYSKSVNELQQHTFDVVITVCDHAKEACPIFPAKTQLIHWSFFDPAEAQGSETEILSVFRNVRDQIRQRIEQHFQS